MPTVYPSLSIPAPRRLAMFRDEAASRTWARPMTWRDVRFATLRSEIGLGQGFNGATPVWYMHEGEDCFRRVRDAHEIVRLDHTGWYTDADENGGNELAIGIVASLPHGRFLAGYRLTVNGERVFFPSLFIDERDAARMADEHARVIGEEESEYQMTERARLDAEDRDAEDETALADRD